MKQPICFTPPAFAKAPARQEESGLFIFRLARSYCFGFTAVNAEIRGQMSEAYSRILAL
jgi:hypothetical protein